jgi:hypothetical protein
MDPKCHTWIEKNEEKFHLLSSRFLEGRRKQVDWRNLFDIPLELWAKCSIRMFEFKCIFEPFFSFFFNLSAKFKCYETSAMKLPLVDRYRSSWWVSDPKTLPVWRKRATFPAHDTKLVNQNEVIPSIWTSRVSWVIQMNETRHTGISLRFTCWIVTSKSCHWRDLTGSSFVLLTGASLASDVNSRRRLDKTDQLGLWISGIYFTTRAFDYNQTHFFWYYKTQINSAPS